MKPILTVAAMLIALSAPAFADGAGDPVKGAKDFKKCKACHGIIDPDGNVIVKGGRTGPNLYGVVGRQAGSLEGFKFGASVIAAGEGGLIWDSENLVEYVLNPKSFLREVTGDGAAKSKMTFKMKKAENVIAYLASLAPAPMAAEGEEGTEGGEAAEGSSDNN